MVRTLLVEHREKKIKIRQRRNFNLDVGDRWQNAGTGHQHADTVHRDGFTSTDQMSECIHNSLLAFPSRQFQDLHVGLVGQRLGMSGAEHVVSDAKLTGRKHLFTVLIVGKCARFAHQRIDDVAIIDCPELLADKSRHCLDDMTPMGHHNVFRPDSQVDALPDQSTGNGVRIRPHMNCAALAHANV